MMDIRDVSRFWWESVTEPHEYALAIAGALVAAKSVLVDVPLSLPWPDRMRDVVRQEMESVLGYECPLFEDLDVGGCGDTPAEIVLDRLALADTRLHYRPYQESPQAYLTRTATLSHKIVWVRGVPKHRLGDWVTFIAGFSPFGSRDGLFVLCTSEGVSAERAGSVGSLHVLPYAGRVGEASVRLFTWAILSLGPASEKGVPYARYLQALLGSLCKGDVEVAAQVARIMDAGVYDPVRALSLVRRDPAFAGRGANECDHILTLMGAGKVAEVLERVWAAQIEVIFPLIERERQKIVGELAEPIDRVLKRRVVYQGHDRILDVHDVEIGTLKHLIGLRTNDGSYEVYVPYATQRRIRLLCRMRNRLAHGEVCSPDDVGLLFGGCSS